MPEFQQKQRPRSSGSSIQPEDEYITDRLARAGQGNEVSRSAGSALSNIDQVLAESGQATKRARDFLRDGEDAAQAGDDNRDSGDDIDDLKNSEKSAASSASVPNTFGYPGAEDSDEEDESGYKPHKLKKGVLNFSLGNRKKAVVGGIGSVMLIGGGFSMYGYFEYMMPKIISNAIDRKATELIHHETQRAVKSRLQSWLTKQLVPAVRACGDLQKTDCISLHTKQNIPKTLTGQLWQSLGDKKAIQKMNNAGIHMFVNTRTGTTVINTPGGPAGLDIEQFSSRNKYEISEYLFNRLEETGHMSFIEKRMLARHLNLPLCNFFCDPLKAKENAKLKITDAIQKYRSALIGLVSKRVIAPSTKAYALLFECMLGSSTCKSPDDMAKRARELQPDIAADDLDALVAEGQKRASQKIVQTIVQESLENLIGKEMATKVATKGVPVVGQVLALLSIAQFIVHLEYAISGLSPVIKVMVNHGFRDMQALPSAQILQTMGSEVTGVDATANSPAAALANAKLLEGYGHSKLIQDEFGTTTPDMQSGEKCTNGETIPKGQSTCVRYDKYPPVIETVQKIPGLKEMVQLMSPKPVAAVLDTVMFLINWPIEKAMMACTDTGSLSFISCTVATGGANIPAVAAMKAAKHFMPQLINYVQQGLNPFVTSKACWMLNTFYCNASEVKGARFIEAAHAGADSNNYSMCKQNYGCAQLSDAQAHKITMAADQEERSQMRFASLSTKLFSFENQYSMVSRIVLASPFTSMSNPDVHTFAGMLNPFKIISSAFLGFSPAHAAAAGMLPSQRFGFPNMGVGDQCVMNDSTTPIDKVDTAPKTTNGTDAIGEPNAKENCDAFNSTINTIAGNGFTDDPLPDASTSQ